MSRTRQQSDGALRKLLPIGLNIAPFLSDKGRPMLAAIDEDHCCEMLAEVPTLAPSYASGSKRSAEQVLQREISMMDDFAPGRFLQGGIHMAPWRHVMRGRDGAIMLAIDSRHRLVASMDVDDVREIDGAREILSALLLRAEQRRAKREKRDDA